MKETKRVLVTGACGQIAYNLLFKIASGEMFGKDVNIALNLLDLEQFKDEMTGLVYELEDSCLPLLKEIKFGFDPLEMFKDIDIGLLVGAKPRGPGMERKDLLLENAKIFKAQGFALNEVAKKDVKVLVVGNPCNTNALIVMKNAKRIPKENFFAMTRLDQNRAKFQLAKKANVNLDDVSNLIVWGNHSLTQVPDFSKVLIKGKKIDEFIDNNWLKTSFMEIIQKRGAEIIQKRKKSSAASAAQAIVDTMKSLYTKEKDIFSLGVYSENNPYGVDNDLIFSFPCKSDGKGNYKIMKGIEIDDFIKEKIKLSEKELQDEKKMIENLL